MTATATARPQLRTGYPLTWVAAVLVLVTPLTITLLLVHGLLRASVTDFVPATDDEMLYWHQISTFARAGFNGGYYTYEEQPAPWALSHFDAHGPFFTALYGSLGRLFGWQRFTPVVFNLVIITMALAGLMRLARPSGVQLAYLGLVVGTCWPLWWWVFSSMQEPLHLGAALVLAGVTYRLMLGAHAKRRWQAAAWGSALLALALIRPFWILLLLPFGLLSRRPLTSRGILAVAAASGAAAAAVWMVGSFVAAPYPQFVTQLLEAVRTSPQAGWEVFVGHLAHFARRLLALEARNALIDLTRFQFLGTLLMLCASLGVNVWRHRARAEKGRGFAANETDLLFHLYNLGGILLVLLALYFPVADQGFRMLAPYLLMTVVLLVLGRRYTLVTAFLAANLLVAPAFVANFTALKARNFNYDALAVQSFSAEVDDWLAYDPTQGPWANTLLLDGQLLCYSVRCDYVTAIPPGRGLSLLFFPDRIEAPLKSKYLLLSPAGLATLQNQLGNQLNIRFLQGTSVGDLYLNLDCACANAQD